MYERPEAFPVWKKILLRHPDFRRDLDVQEETYIMQRKYLSLVRDKRLPTIKQLLLAQDFLTQGAIGPAAARLWLPIHVVPELRVPLEGPFDLEIEPDEPLISGAAKARAISSYNLSKEPTGMFTLPGPGSRTPAKTAGR